MRKIDKSSINLATKYKEWIENNSITKPEYSSKNEYYKDIVMNLLYLQAGLCAYTEIFLVDIKNCNESNWHKGKYKTNYNHKGQLDHFNPKLKQSASWDWNNFFVVDSDINMYVKNNQVVDDILKPDLPEYNEFELFEYDFNKHVFIPNSKITSEGRKQRILQMLKVLGINYDPIVDARRKYFAAFEDDIKKKLSDYNEAKKEVYQFITAFAMSEPYLNAM